MKTLKIKLGPARIAKTLWEKTAPEDQWPASWDTAWHWIAYQDCKPVGFITVRRSDTEGYLFIAATGVLKSARGQALQVKMTKRVIKYAQRHKFKGILTYTAANNAPSIISLLKCRFLFYKPENRDLTGEWHYFSRTWK